MNQGHIWIWLETQLVHIHFKSHGFSDIPLALPYIFFVYPSPTDAKPCFHVKGLSRKSPQLGSNTPRLNYKKSPRILNGLRTARRTCFWATPPLNKLKFFLGVKSIATRG
jgi:hypothetical protein